MVAEGGWQHPRSRPRSLYRCRLPEELVNLFAQARTLVLATQRSGNESREGLRA